MPVLTCPPRDKILGDRDAGVDRVFFRDRGDNSGERVSNLFRSDFYFSAGQAEQICCMPGLFKIMGSFKTDCHAFPPGKRGDKARIHPAGKCGDALAAPDPDCRYNRLIERAGSRSRFNQTPHLPVADHRAFLAVLTMPK